MQAINADDDVDYNDARLQAVQCQNFCKRSKSCIADLEDVAMLFRAISDMYTKQVMMMMIMMMVMVMMMMMMMVVVMMMKFSTCKNHV